MSWVYHVKVALGCSIEENLECIAESVKAAVGAGKEALVDCEHFFDGYKANPTYALACAKTAYDSGARRVIILIRSGTTKRASTISKRVSATWASVRRSKPAP